MEKNDIIRVDHQFQEEEIDIFKLLDIFIKNIKLFLIITIIGSLLTGLYVAKRLIFDKVNTIYINYTLNYDELESYLGGKVYYPKKNPEGMLLEDKYLEILFDKPILKELYEKQNLNNKGSVTVKREFLSQTKLLDISSLKKITKDNQDLISPNTYRATVKLNKRIDKDKVLAKGIMNEYLEVLNEYYNENIFQYIAERKNYLQKVLPPLKKQLEENAILNQGNVPQSIGENNYFKYMYPIKVSNIDTYYEKYRTFESEYQSIKSLSDAELDKVSNFIKFDTSIIVDKSKSGNFMILGIGILVSVCLGVLATFLKEFVEEYKKNKRQTKTL